MCWINNKIQKYLKLSQKSDEKEREKRKRDRFYIKIMFQNLSQQC